MFSKIFLQLYRDEYSSEAKKVGHTSLIMAISQLKLILGMIEIGDICDKTQVIHIINSCNDLPKQIAVKLTKQLSDHCCSSIKTVIKREIDFLDEIKDFSQVNLSGVVSLSNREENPALNVWGILKFLSKIEERVKLRTKESNIEVIPEVTVNIVNSLIFTGSSDFFVFASNDNVEKLIDLAKLINEIVRYQNSYLIKFKINGINYQIPNVINSETVSSGISVTFPESLKYEYFRGYSSVDIKIGQIFLQLIFQSSDQSSEMTIFSSASTLYSPHFGVYAGEEVNITPDLEIVLTGFSSVESDAKLCFNSVSGSIPPYSLFPSYDDFIGRNPQSNLTRQQYENLLEILSVLLAVVLFVKSSGNDLQTSSLPQYNITFLENLLVQNGISYEKQDQLFLSFSLNFDGVNFAGIKALFYLLLSLLVFFPQGNTCTSLGSMEMNKLTST